MGSEITPPDAATAHIGPNTAYFRRLRGMKASELARRIGVSASLISQIERGHAKPSVGTLVLIAGALDLPLDTIVDARDPAAAVPARPAPVAKPAPPASPAAGGRYVVRKGGRATITVSNGVQWERLAPEGFSEDVYFAVFSFAAGAQSNSEMYTHPGADLLVVTQGQLTAYVAFDRFVLDKGDSIAFPSTIPHRYANESSEEARAVSVVLSGRTWAASHGVELPDAPAAAPPAL